jgi:hypothetical protein
MKTLYKFFKTAEVSQQITIHQKVKVEKYNLAKNKIKFNYKKMQANLNYFAKEDVRLKDFAKYTKFSNPIMFSIINFSFLQITLNSNIISSKVRKFISSTCKNLRPQKRKLSKNHIPPPFIKFRSNLIYQQNFTLH